MNGLVKFNCHWTQTGPVISDEQFEIINYWREVLYNMDLIGAYENGVGFGNISMRTGRVNSLSLRAPPQVRYQNWNQNIMLKWFHSILMKMQFNALALLKPLPNRLLTLPSTCQIPILML